MICLIINEKGKFALKETIRVNFDRKKKITALLNGIDGLRSTLNINEICISMHEKYGGMSDFERFLIENVNHYIRKVIRINERTIEKEWEKLLK